jgi:3-hydroxy-D-aspartate aldolase
MIKFITNCTIFNPYVNINMKFMEWFEINDIDTIDTPALFVYKDKVERNINKSIDIAGAPSLLIPHIKTIKSRNLVKMWINAGVTACKAATIAEAELAALSGMNEVLLAYPLIGPKLTRLINLIQNYSSTKFHGIVDDLNLVDLVDNQLMLHQSRLGLYIDLNVGMNRTGISVKQTEKIQTLIEKILSSKYIDFKGFHAYDGHVEENDISDRQKQIDDYADHLNCLMEFIPIDFKSSVEVVIGGSPSLALHANKTYPYKVRFSPGTIILWDGGYASNFQDLGFEPALVMAGRVISKPSEELITTDIGHKSIAPENPIQQRLFLLNDNKLVLKSQSEEHGVFYANHSDKELGDIVFALPYHVCPTVNLHQSLYVVEENKVIDEWVIEARDRRIGF